MIFLAIAIVLMVLLDVFVMSPERYKGGQGSLMRPSVFENIGSEVDDFTSAQDVQKRLQGPKGLETRKSLVFIPQEQKEEKDSKIADAPQAVEKPPVIKEVKKPKPAAKKVIAPPFTGTPRIAIIIDDMGLNAARNTDVVKLSKPLTLAYLPYAPQLEKKTREAKSFGHELMIHVPMQPIKNSMDAGPNVLTVEMDKREIDKALKTVFKSFDGYAGINNHMGSRMTQDPERMAMVMEALKERNLYFIDSKTIYSSVAADVARDSGVAYGERDVFLDHEPTYEFAITALKKTEDIARRRGFAIAIGHPKEGTIKALAEWIPTLKDKGIELVPASELVHRPVDSH